MIKNKIEFKIKIEVAINICAVSTPNEKPINATRSTPSLNVIWLKKFAKPLVDLGIKRINISLDTLNPEKFKKITRWGRLEQVLEGIQEAKKSGLSIKINKVALKKTNQDELNDFVKWCGDEGFDLT